MKKLLPGVILVILTLIALVVISIYLRTVAPKTLPQKSLPTNTARVDDGSGDMVIGVPDPKSTNAQIDINADIPLPENIPSDIPVISEARAIHINQDVNTNITSIYFVTNLTFEQVADYYTEQLSAQEWILKELNPENKGLVGAFKNDRSVSVGITSDKEGTVFVLNYSKNVNSQP